jgi:tetratricopeptide (TPR) repeat protein
LKDDYISLGQELNIIRDEGSIDAEKLARYVKHWLENPSRAGWLLVYDNAHNYEAIRELLPTRKGKLLVTSRYTDGWPQENISVDVFTIEESRAYIQKVLGIPLSENDSTKIDTLAETLGRLPLALAQASAYIKKNKISISRYLELYEQKKREILSKKKSLLSDELLLNSHKGRQFTSVYITWDITMHEVQRESLLAANWLNACACLASNDIPDFLLKKFANTPENNPNSEIFEEALGTSYSYSMLTINEQNHSARIHCLVQEVIKLKWLTEEKKNNLFAVFHLLKDTFPYSHETLEDYANKRRLLPHLDAFLPHLEAWQQEASEVSPELRKEIEHSYLEGNLLLSKVHLDLRNARKVRDSLERALPIKEKHYGPDHPGVATMLSNLGVAYRNLGDFKKQLELQEQALVINERNYGPDHPEVANMLSNLGNAYWKLGDSKKQLEVQERALVIKEKHYGPDHPEIAKTLTYVGVAYGDLGDYKRQLELQERALAIIEKHFGPEHPEVVITLSNLGKAYGKLGDSKKQLDKKQLNFIKGFNKASV